MVRTRCELKVKIKEFIQEQKQPFKTQKVVDYCRTLTNNINLSPNRIQVYVRSSGQVDYNNSKKIWIRKGFEICHTGTKEKDENGTILKTQ